MVNPFGDPERDLGYTMSKLTGKLDYLCTSNVPWKMWSDGLISFDQMRDLDFQIRMKRTEQMQMLDMERARFGPLKDIKETLSEYETQFGLCVKRGGLLGREEDYEEIRTGENDGDKIIIYRNTLFCRDERWFHSNTPGQDFILVSDRQYVGVKKNSDGWWKLNPKMQWVKKDGKWIFENNK